MWNCVHTVNFLYITYIVSVILLKLVLSLTHNQVLELVSNNFIADTSTYMDYFEKIIYFFPQEIENLSCQLEEMKGPFPTMDPRRIKELEDALTKVEHDKTNLIRVK